MDPVSALGSLKPGKLLQVAAEERQFISCKPTLGGPGWLCEGNKAAGGDQVRVTPFPFLWLEWGSSGAL
jgi:hypothetical protein